jgi:iron(III) transport system permease protein
MARIDIVAGFPRLSRQSIFYWALSLAVVIMILSPVVLVVIGSFQTGGPGQQSTYSLEAWKFAVSDPGVLASVWNTIVIAVLRQSIALVIAIFLAWVLARTDVPGSRWLEFMFWIAFFLPTLPVVQAWVMLLDPEYGVLNRLVKFLFSMEKGPFNIYSFWGIVWAHLVTNSIAIKVILLTPVFRNMDASLEEASNVSGAGNVRTLLWIVVPIMTPIVTVVTLLSVIHSLQAFEIELVLGFPIRFFVFSTQVYYLLHQEPPLFPLATALSVLVLVLMLPLVVLQRWLSVRRSYQTISGQYKGHKIRLRSWRYPIFVAVLATALLVTVFPFVVLVVGTFMKLFGFFGIPEPWTTAHWERVFNDPILLKSIYNTIVLAAGTALAAVILCTAIAYIVMRSRFVGRGVLDFVSWLPSTLPGIILAVGLLWLFLGNPVLRSLYGTIVIMILALVISRITTAVQVIKSNFAQLGKDIEEAARTSGAGWWHAFRYVLLPLITPTLLLVGALGFIAAAREVSTVVLLSTSATRPLSLLQLDFMVEGRYESAAVVGVMIMTMTTAAALAARVLGRRAGLEQ